MEIVASDVFRKQANKLDGAEQERLRQAIRNIIDGRVRGKPLRYDRKGMRELYLGSKRLYFRIEGEFLYLLEYSHKDNQ